MQVLIRIHNCLGPKYLVSIQMVVNMIVKLKYYSAAIRNLAKRYPINALQTDGNSSPNFSVPSDVQL